MGEARRKRQRETAQRNAAAVRRWAFIGPSNYYVTWIRRKRLRESGHFDTNGRRIGGEP